MEAERKAKAPVKRNPAPLAPEFQESGPVVRTELVQPANMPAARVGLPDHTDFHLIQDFELMQLSKPENGALGALGFTLLGCALSSFPSSIELLFSSTTGAVASTQLWQLALFCGSTVGALICLVLFGVYWWRNAGLAERIRARPKAPLGGPAHK